MDDKTHGKKDFTQIPERTFTINSKVKMSKRSLNAFRIRNLLLSTSFGKQFAVVASIAIHLSLTRYLHQGVSKRDCCFLSRVTTFLHFSGLI